MLATPTSFSLSLSFFLCKMRRDSLQGPSLSLEYSLKHMLGPGEGQRAQLEWKSQALCIFTLACLEGAVTQHPAFLVSPGATRMET